MDRGLSHVVGDSYKTRTSSRPLRACVCGGCPRPSACESKVLVHRRCGRGPVRSRSRSRLDAVRSGASSTKVTFGLLSRAGVVLPFRADLPSSRPRSGGSHAATCRRVSLPSTWRVYTPALRAARPTTCAMAALADWMLARPPPVHPVREDLDGPSSAAPVTRPTPVYVNAWISARLSASGLRASNAAMTAPRTVQYVLRTARPALSTWLQPRVSLLPVETPARTPLKRCFM